MNKIKIIFNEKIKIIKRFLYTIIKLIILNIFLLNKYQIVFKSAVTNVANKSIHLKKYNYSKLFYLIYYNYIFYCDKIISSEKIKSRLNKINLKNKFYNLNFQKNNNIKKKLIPLFYNNFYNKNFYLTKQNKKLITKTNLNIKTNKLNKNLFYGFIFKKNSPSIFFLKQKIKNIRVYINTHTIIYTLSMLFTFNFSSSYTLLNNFLKLSIIYKFNLISRVLRNSYNFISNKLYFYPFKFFKYSMFFIDRKFNPKDLNFFSNKYLINNINNVDLIFNDLNQLFIYKFRIKNKFFNNYYPLFVSDERSQKTFFNNLKSSYNLNYIFVTNKLIISFFESFFKKKIYIKTTNNQFHTINNVYFKSLLLEYKKFQPSYFKNYLFSDFLKIIWYSFFLKDLKLLSNFVSKFMETLNFKNHKKFVNFMQNFFNKYANFFIDILKIKGFFFDIRGKVGVTGSSKKRHMSFKFGSLNRSSKNKKINFNQNLVRTYSGVLGLTYIICY